MQSEAAPVLCTLLVLAVVGLELQFAAPREWKAAAMLSGYLGVIFH